MLNSVIVSKRGIDLEYQVKEIHDFRDLDTSQSSPRCSHPSSVMSPNAHTQALLY